MEVVGLIVYLKNSWGDLNDVFQSSGFYRTCVSDRRQRFRLVHSSIFRWNRFVIGRE